MAKKELWIVVFQKGDDLKVAGLPIERGNPELAKKVARDQVGTCYLTRGDEPAPNQYGNDSGLTYGEAYMQRVLFVSEEANATYGMLYVDQHQIK